MSRIMWTTMAVVTVVFCAGAMLYNRSTKSSKPSVSLCTPGPDERCPTDQFVADYRALIHLQKEVADMANAPEFKKVQEKSDQLTGMSQRLGTQVPAGFQWDAGKMKFTAVKPPPTPTPASPAAPAQEKK